MASVEARGYVNRPLTKEGSKGSYAKFTLAVQQKEKDGSKKKVFFDCVDFKNECPPDGAYVTVKGWFSVNEYVSKAGANAGKTMQGLNINVQEIEVAPPRDGAVAKASVPAAPPTDPFGLDK